MAKKQDKDLLQALRESGVRKKVAQTVTKSAGRARRGKKPDAVTQTVENLRKAAAELESRVTGSSRSAAAKKAVKTRKRKAAARSAAARKAAKTRSRVG
jgi:hypothetical protein